MSGSPPSRGTISSMIALKNEYAWKGKQFEVISVIDSHEVEETPVKSRYWNSTSLRFFAQKEIKVRKMWNINLLAFHAFLAFPCVQKSTESMNCFAEFCK